jgi:hypothetical protein
MTARREKQINASAGNSWIIPTGNSTIHTMSNSGLFTLSILRALVEVAMLALLGQGIVGLLSGTRRQENPIYRIFLVVTRPAILLTRAITPGAIIDRHIPFIAFFLLVWLWVSLAWFKHHLAS